jgi:hypothetical protein
MMHWAAGLSADPASDLACFVTGAAVTVDGGLLAAAGGLGEG